MSSEFQGYHEPYRVHHKWNCTKGPCLAMGIPFLSKFSLFVSSPTRHLTPLSFPLYLAASIQSFAHTCQKATRISKSPAPVGLDPASDSYTLLVKPPDSIVIVTQVSASQRRQTSSSKTFRLYYLNKRTNEWQGVCPHSAQYYDLIPVGLPCRPHLHKFDCRVAGRSMAPSPLFAHPGLAKNTPPN